MTLRDIEVRRIAPGELPSFLCLQLNYLYHTELGHFVAMYDRENQILYVNWSIPDNDVQRFVEMCSYTGPYINDPDCPIADTVNFVYEAYGADVWSILQDAYQARRKVIEDAEADRKAAVIIPEIEKAIQAEVDGESPDPFNEEIVPGKQRRHETER